MAKENFVDRRRFLAGAAGAGATLIAGCTSTDDQGNGEGLSGEISISGSSTVFPLAEAVAERFMEEYPEVTVSVKSTGTGGGFSNNFCPGRSEFNNGSRQITEGEREKCEENGVEPMELKVATDAMTVVVNNEADWIDCVTIEELRQLWRRDGPSTWQDVNEDWPNEEINRFGPADTSGTFDYFREVVLGEEYNHTRDYSPTEKDNSIVQGVQGSEFAIGYFGFSYYYLNPDSVTALSIDGGDGCVMPSVDTAKSGEYTPLSRPLFTYVNKNALTKDHVAEFCRFYLNNTDSEKLVAESVGYVPLTEDQQALQRGRLELAIDDVRDA